MLKTDFCSGIMVKVLRHGDIFASLDNATGEWTEMVKVVFIEQEGRAGVNKTLSNSSAALAAVSGEEASEIGIKNTRTHTQPIRSDKLGKYPINAEFPLFINRELWSMPQMANQEDKVPRIIDGKITYFKTELNQVPEDDKDFRTAVITTAEMVPQELIMKATRTLRATQVRTVQRAESSAQMQNASSSEDIDTIPH